MNHDKRIRPRTDDLVEDQHLVGRQNKSLLRFLCTDGCGGKQGCDQERQNVVLHVITSEERSFGGENYTPEKQVGDLPRICADDADQNKSSRPCLGGVDAASADG